MMRAINRFFQGNYLSADPNAVSFFYHTDPLSAPIPPARSRRDYFAIWDEWVQNAPPGQGEYRNLAAEQLWFCLEQMQPILDLRAFHLSELPELPAHIEELWACHNQLTGLPALPSGLEHLSVQNNQLRELPVLPASLRFIDASSNRLTALPESIVQLDPRATVRVVNNPFSEATLRTLLRLNEDSSYRGPAIHFSMTGTSSGEQQTIPLISSLGLWFSENAGEIALEKWLTIQQEPGAAEFSRFLCRLRETVGARNAPQFKTQVNDWLTKIADEPELRKLSFGVAEGASASCEDRVALTWNEMQKAALVHAIEQGEYDAQPAALITLAREMFRLEQLESIAREVVTRLHFVDEIEAFLGLQVALHKPLKLTHCCKKMRYFFVCGLSRTHIRQAKNQVREKENNEFPGWLAQWSPWHKVLERIEPARFKAALDARYEALEKSYQPRIDSLIAAQGLERIPEVEARIGKQVMDEISLKIFLELTNKTLSARNITSLSVKPWRSRSGSWLGRVTQLVSG